MSEWRIRKIKDFAFTASGGTPSTAVQEYWVNGKVPWINSGELSKNSYIRKPTVYISDSALKNSSAKLMPIGTVVIALTGATTGMSALLEIETSGNQSITGIFPSKEHDPRFLLYVLKKDKNKILNYNVGSAQPHINKAIVDSFEVLMPDVPEQSKIARILSTVDAVIENTEAAIAKYKAIKQGMMHNLFTRGLDANGKLRPRYKAAPHLYKQTELGWVPKEWEVNKISDTGIQVIDGDRGVNYPHENEFEEQGFCLFLNANNVTQNGFVFQNNQFINQAKDSLMGTGKIERYDTVITTRGTVGNIAYYSDNVPYEHIRINSGMLILRNAEQGLLPEFLYYSLKNYLFEIGFRRVVSGSAQPQLPMKDLKSFYIVKPDPKEQQGMIKICLSIEQTLSREEGIFRKYKFLKQGFMSDLLTGRVRVRVEESDVMEVGNGKN